MNRALRSVRIECPDYQGFFPDPTFLEVANQKTFEYQQKHQRTMMVEETLQKALGGSPYVASGLMTRHGYFVGMFLKDCKRTIFIVRSVIDCLQITRW